MSDSEKMITIGDVRQAGYCVSGAKNWFERNGLDFRKFLHEGITEAEFLGTGDHLATVVVRLKNERNSRG